MVTHPVAALTGALIAWAWPRPAVTECPVSSAVASPDRSTGDAASLPLPPMLRPPAPRSPARTNPSAEPVDRPWISRLLPAPNAEDDPRASDKAADVEASGDAQARLAAERRAQAAEARAGLVAAASPDAEQLARIDQVISDMNADLQAVTDDIEARHADGSSADRRELLAWTADALDILVTAEDGLTGTLTPEQLAAVPPEALDPLVYVQPAP